MLITSDNHFPLHDPHYQNALLKFASDRKLDVFLNLGDHYDFESVSRFDQDPARGLPTLQREFDSSADYWRTVARVAKRAIFVQGNHEHRLARTLAANPGLFGLRALEDWHTLAGIPPKVEVHPYGTHVQVGLVWGEHGDQIRGSAVPARSALAQRGGRAIVFGHWHRLGYWAQTGRDEHGRIVDREAVALGHGSTAQAHGYAGTVPNWQQGFAYAEHYTTAGRPEVRLTLIRVVAGRFVYDGKLYDGRK